MKQVLRPYQVAARDKLRKALKTHRATALVLPTGAGKTTVAADIIERCIAKDDSPNRVLFLAHRTTLVEQCSTRLDENGLTRNGIIMGNHPRRRPLAPIQVASIQTLARRPLLDPPPTLIIVDECHRSLSPSYVALLEQYPDAYIIGLTATPWRLDGRGLGRMYQKLIVGVTYGQLIAEGYLVGIRCFCPWVPDLRGLRLVAGDYDLGVVAEQANQRHRLDQIVTHWLSLADNQPTIAFAINVAHSKLLTAAFLEAGVSAEHIDGTTKNAERAAVNDRLLSGATKVVSNCGVWTEGWDSPPVRVGIMARPTMSLALFMQCAGRILRPYAGKDSALWLDFAGGVVDHGWPTLDRRWSLADREEVRNAAAAPTVKLCESCFAALPSHVKQCPECGHIFTVDRAQELRLEGAAPLVEVQAPDAVSPHRGLQDQGYRPVWTRGHQWHDGRGAWAGGGNRGRS